MRFYALLRESSDPQERKKGLARQWRQLRRFCETWRGGPHEIALSMQIMESATRGYREQWQDAVEQGIKLFQQGVIDGILFPEVDRETRNPLISVPILNLAIDAGVPVFFAGEDLLLDPRDHDAVERYTDAASKSCAYLATMVKKCRAGRFDRADQDGKLPSNTKMFGFNIVDGRRVPNQAEAAVLVEAAQIALKEGRLGPAVKWLNERGFRTTQGKPFTTVTLRGLFRNRALIGETTINFKEKVVTLPHEPILHVTTFEALQAMLDERRLRAPRSDVFYTLSGLLWCGSSHERFEPTKSGKNRYYRCEGHCGEKAKRKEDLEFEVWDAFGDYLERRESQREYLELLQQTQAKLEKDLAEVEGDIAENNREWETLLAKDLADYPDIIINDKKRELRAKSESLLRAKAKISAELEALPKINPVEVERALSDLARSWHEGYPAPPYPRRHPDMARRLTDEQLHWLRETLLKLSCRIAVKYGAIFIVGKVPLGASAKQGAS